MFEKISGSWAQVQKLTLSEPREFDEFGSTVLLGPGGSLPVGARGRELDFVDQGAVYVYASDSLFRNGFENTRSPPDRSAHRVFRLPRRGVCVFELRRDGMPPPVAPLGAVLRVTHQPGNPSGPTERARP